MIGGWDMSSHKRTAMNRKTGRGYGATWIDKRTGVRVKFDWIDISSCCPHETWWRLTDGDTRKFRVEGPLEFTPRLEPFFWDREATPSMVEAWSRFCKAFARSKR